jgi:hypothetical protein
VIGKTLDRKNGTGRTRPAELDRQKGRGRKEQAERTRQNGTGRTGQTELGRHDKTARASLSGQECRKRVAKKGKARTAMTGGTGRM